MNTQNIAVKAAVLRDVGGPFLIEPMNLDQPRDDEVLVRIVATGVCHTDASVREGTMPLPAPIVLGHEGAGIVEAVGRNVTRVAAGDHVVLSYHSCGECAECLAGEPTACVHVMALNFGCCRTDGSHALHSAQGVVNDRFFGQSSFATYAIANQHSVVVVPKDAPLELLGPLGCGFQTGAGAVLATLKVGVGDSLAVFGSGAVGLAAIMAAKAAGASIIIAVDIVQSRLDLARELGATHLVDGHGDVAGEIAAIMPGGVRYSVDTTGIADVMRNAVLALATRGVCAFVTTADPAMRIELDSYDFLMRRKSVIGIVGGNSVPQILIPILVEMHRSGSFPLEKLVRFYEIDQINEAFADAASGKVIKPVIRMP